METADSFRTFLLEDHLHNTVHREEAGKLFGEGGFMSRLHPGNYEMLVSSESFLDQHLVGGAQNSVHVLQVQLQLHFLPALVTEVKVGRLLARWFLSEGTLKFLFSRKTREFSWARSCRLDWAHFYPVFGLASHRIWFRVLMGRFRDGRVAGVVLHLQL